MGDLGPTSAGTPLNSVCVAMGTCACAEVDQGQNHSDADMASDVAKCNVTEHNISVNELAVRLRTSPELGLTNEQAAFRLKEDGQNIAPNTIGFYPGWEDQKIVVIRNGKQMMIPETRLVRGDLVELKPSAKRCPADVRIVSITEHPFTISHSDISDEYYHDCSEVATYKDPLEAKNLTMASAIILNGAAKGIVFNTGKDTMISTIMAHGMSFRMKRTNEFRELTPYGTMSKMKKDREKRELMCRKGLYRACQIADVKMAGVWLTRGASPNWKNDEQGDRTSLHAAVIGSTTQHSALVKLLLSKEADPNVTDETGKCVLDWTPRSKLTASLLEPLKKARSSGSSSPRSRGFGSYSPSGAQSDGFAQMDEDEQLVARAVGRKTTLANSYKPNMGQMSPATAMARAKLGLPDSPSNSPRSSRSDSGATLGSMQGALARQPMGSIASSPRSRGAKALAKGARITFAKAEPKYVRND